MWLFTANDDFYGGVRREQAPLASFQVHVGYTLRPRLWLAADATDDGGGNVTLDGEEKNDAQRNSREGYTMSVPVGKRSSLKFSWATGFVARVGGDFSLTAGALTVLSAEDWHHSRGREVVLRCCRSATIQVDLRDGVREEFLESGAEVIQPRLAVRRAQDAVLRALAPAIATDTGTRGIASAGSRSWHSRTSPAAGEDRCRPACRSWMFPTLYSG